jgi:uncharacterized membrane-anchored protein
LPSKGIIMRKTLVAVAGIALLVLVNLSIVQREQLLTEGRMVLLELAPRDPRSLMQGDYVAIRFRAALDASGAAKTDEASNGHLVLGVDERGLGKYRRLDAGAPLAADEVRMRYRVRDRNMKFGTNAYFFQEGQGNLYERARYGEFRVDAKGEAILIALRGEDLQRLGESATSRSGL